MTGSHAIQVSADRVFDGDLSDYDMIVLPGGMPGSAHLRDNQALIQELQISNKKGRNWRPFVRRQLPSTKQGY